MQLPKQSDFPETATFYIKEFDVPLVQMPDGKWFNWFGGKHRLYDVSQLKQGSFWEADSFQEWQSIIESSFD